MENELSKGFTGIEINGVRFSNIGEMLRYMDKQREQIIKAKEIISEWEDSFCCGADYLYLGNKGKELRIKSQKFLNNEVEK